MNYKVHKLSTTWILCVLLIITILGITGCASNNITVQKTDQATDSAVDLKLITGISTIENDSAVVVSVNSSRGLIYSSIKQPLPLSVVLYFPGTVFDDSMISEIVSNSIISSVKALELPGSDHTSKIIISLIKDVPYEVTSEATGLKIVFAKSVKESAIAETDVLKTNKAIDQNSSQLFDKGNPPVDIEKVVSGTVDSDIAWVNRIDFSSEDAGRSTIIIGTTKPVEYKIEKAGNKRLNLRLGKTKIPPYHHRPLITTRFASAVDRIIPMQALLLKDTSVLSIELRELVPYFVEQTGNLLFIHFEASSIPPRPLKKTDLPPWKKILEQTVLSEADRNSAENKFSRKQALSAPQLEKEGYESEAGFEQNKSKIKKYTGEKIALDFYETDIKNVFRILKEISGKNFAIDKDVTGTVSLAFDQPVPWDQVFDLVLEMNQLGMVNKGNIIRIATIETLKNEDTQFKNLLKAKQDSALQENMVTEFLSVNYGDVDEIVKLIQLEDRGSVSVDKRNNMIIITAAPVVIKRVKEIVKKVDKVTRQVVIEARIVEVTENFSRAIGVNWELEGDLNKITGGDAFDYDMAFNHAVAGTSAIGATFERIVGSNVLLNAQLTAQQAEGNAKIISSPKVITLDNETATIKQGVEFPYLERDDSGGSSVKFKDVDLLLEVTPHTTPDGRISMELKITKNDVLEFFGGVPRVNTKEVETVLLVDDGDTLVIGGIMTSSVRSGEDGTPWLSKIPVLGWLFKSKTKSNEKGELLIFITPTIVQI